MLTRKLLTGGAAAGPTTPADIPSVRHWVDMLDLSTMWTTEARTTPATLTSPVGSILDKVNGNYYTQTDANSTKRPTAQSTGLSFDGSNDYLGTPKSNFDWMSPLEQCVRIFVVSTPTTIAADRTMFSLGSYNYPCVQVYFNSSKLSGVVGSSSTVAPFPNSYYYSATTGTTTAVKQLSEWHFDPEAGALHPLYLATNNGTATAKDTNANQRVSPHVSDTLSCIGGVTSGFTTEPVWLFSGTIQEIVITGEMTAGEFTELMTYFQDTHGLSLGV